MDVTARLLAWLKRHPVKSPEASDHAAFAAQVMERIKAPAPRARPLSLPGLEWWLRPRPALALAGVSATLAVAVVAGLRAFGPAAPYAVVLRDAAVLVALDDEAAEPLAEDDAMLEEALAADALMLAESMPSDEAWLEDTLALLRALEEPAEDGTALETAGEEAFEDLELLDEQELALQS